MSGRFHRFYLSVAVAALLLLSVPAVAQAQPTAAGGGSPSSASLVIVQVTGASRLSSVETALGERGAVVMERSRGNALLVSVPVGVERGQFVASLEDVPGVRFAQANAVMRAADTTNDPKFPFQWGLNDIGAPSAWATSEGSGVAVAVIDTGVDASQPDLAGHVVYYRNYVNPGASAYDDNGHGTHVAGIICATRNNGIEGAGAAPEATVYAFKVLDATGSGSDFDVAQAIRDAVDYTPCRIISMSLGGTADGGDPILASAVAYAQSKGALVIAAAGNDGVTTPSYPAAIAGVIGVGAVDSYNHLASFSNYGPTDLDVVAPGVNILSTLPGTTMQFWSGTSMATPFVSGAAAVLWAAHPALTASQLASVLQDTAVDLGAAGVDSYYGHGLVRIDLALAALDVPAPVDPAPAVTPTPTPAPAPVSTPDSTPTGGATQTTDPDGTPAVTPAVPATTTLSIGESRSWVYRYRGVRLSGLLTPGAVGEYVRVYAMKPGTTTWVRVKTVLTSSLTSTGAARWTCTYAPNRRGTWKFRVRFSRDNALAASTSRTIRLRVY